MAHNQPEASPTETDGPLQESGCDGTVASGSGSSSNFTLTNNGTIWAGDARTVD